MKYFNSIIFFIMIVFIGGCCKDESTNNNQCELSISVTPSGDLIKNIGDTLSFVIDVKNQDKDFVANSKIIIEDDLKKMSSEVTTNGSGQATYYSIVTCPETSNQNRNIRFQATKSGCKSSTTLSINIKIDELSKNLEVSVNPISQNIGQGEFYSFDVRITCNCIPVDGAKVECTIPFGTSYNGITDSEGVPKPEIKNWRVPGDQGAGNYQICFWVSKEGYNSGSGCGTLIVKEELCSMMIVSTCPPESLKVGDSHQISFIVKEQNTGQPIEDAKITVTNLRWLGTTPVYLKTNSSGYAEYSGVVPQGEEGMTANYTYYASKDGCTPTTIKRCYIYVSQ